MDFQTAPVVTAKLNDGFKMTFSGPIHTNVSWLEGEFDHVINAKPKIVELDLTGTEYISSLGLGMLVALNNSIKANGGIVRVVAIKTKTMQILQMAFLHKLLEIAPDALISNAPKK